MRNEADLRGGTLLVSFNHVIDPHFVTFFSSSLCTTIRNPNPNPNPNLNRNPTVIPDPPIGPTDQKIVAVQVRPAGPPSSACCRVPMPPPPATGDLIRAAEIND